MKLIRISESDNFIVDYDKERGMYQVSVFEDNHFQDEYWFDAYEEKEVTNKTELIGFLEMFKENAKRIMGENKYMNAEQVCYCVDNIIKYINDNT